MTQGKGNRDEKLIEELYEKLYWYTYEASEEEFDDKEVDAIVRLLDVLDPKEDDPKFPSDPKAAFERFKSRYGLEEEFAKENVEHKEAVSGGMDSAVSTAADANPGNAGGSEEEAAVGFGGTGSAVLEAEPGADRKPDTDGGEVMASEEHGRKRGVKWKRRLVRLTAGAAACLVLMLSVNFGSYALKKKSFFEVVRDEVGRTKVTVTGNVEDVGDNSEYTKKYSNWNEVEKEIGNLILYPNYLPDGYLLDGITIQSMTTKKRIVAVYNGGTGEKYTRLEIDIYNGDFTERTVALDDNWKLIYNDERIEYYQNGDQIEAIFMANNSMYFLNSNESFDVVERIVQNIE
ncbi:hypothetical protein [Eisenbergiella sp.]